MQMTREMFLHAERQGFGGALGGLSGARGIAAGFGREREIALGLIFG
jgi:hypothetical protein